jgi:hypothetical protein
MRLQEICQPGLQLSEGSTGAGGPASEVALSQDAGEKLSLFLTVRAFL